METVLEIIKGENVVIGIEGGTAVAIDTRITPALKAEGIARDFVHYVQTMRKKLGLTISQRIKVYYNADVESVIAIDKYKDYICEEILADILWYDYQVEIDKQFGVNIEVINTN